MESIDTIFLQVAALDKHLKRLFYLKIGFNLTIAIRSVWSNPNTLPDEKIEGMKYVNELSHRNFNWLWRLNYSDVEEFDDSGCLEEIKYYCKVYRPVSGEIIEAVKASYRHITTKQS